MIVSTGFQLLSCSTGSLTSYVQAASRCIPQLPEDVLARAASHGDVERRDGRFHLETHLNAPSSGNEHDEAEIAAINSAKCQRAMLLATV
jgi:hypothetical protein